MSTARRIFALLIAASLAMLPAAGHAGVAVKPVDIAATDDVGAHDMSAMHGVAAMDDMDCCPHKSHGSDKAVDDCAAMAGCILCVGFLSPVLADLVSPVPLTSSAIPFISTPLNSQTGSPPFRPPRV
jgi:hypothetical protein